MSVWPTWSSLGPILSGLGAGLAATVALLALIVTGQRESAKQRDQRNDERFKSVVEGLGAKDVTEQVGAAAMLRSFLQRRKESRPFYLPVFDLAAAHLRMQPPVGLKSTQARPLVRELGRALAESYALARDYARAEKLTRWLDASRSQLQHADLYRADLDRVWMPDAQLIYANLDGATLQRATLTGVNLSAADVTKGKLTSADLTRATISGATFTNADLCCARLIHVKAAPLAMPGRVRTLTDFSGAELRRANLRDAELSEALFTQANLYKADLTRAKGTEVKFVGTILEHANLSDVTFERPVFREAKLRRATLTSAVLPSVSFVGADLTGAIPRPPVVAPP